ncbi:MAG: iron-sulfur cluster-binding domain-containing protein [Agriterribacter sp.]
MIEHVLTFRITRFITETTEARTFVLEEINGEKVIYKSGQFLTLIFNEHGHEVRRSYSISSTPGIDPYICITVKRVYNGSISRLLLDHYKEGDVLTALAPSGKFVSDESAKLDKDIFLFAAGSGIVPVLSLLKDMLYNRAASSVFLFYQNHSAQETIFRKAIQQMAIEFSEKFTWFDFVSTRMEVTSQMRRMNNETLEAFVPAHMKYDKSSAEFFICGPISFMRMCQFTLIFMGFAQQQIKREYFVIDTAPPPPLIVNPLPRNITIKDLRSPVSFISSFPKTILQSALDNHIKLPYSCKGGKCSTCVAKCISGEVVLSMNDVLTEEDLRKGLILTCVGYAVTDVVLSYEV